MTSPHPFGPEPFRFRPTDGLVRGTAFTLPYRVLATLVVGGTSVWAWRLWAGGEVRQTMGDGATWFLAALAIMLWTWWCILRSETRVEPTGLHQRWIWDKRMEFDDMAYARLIDVPWLRWFVAPRLYVRTLAGKFTVFYGATPELIAEFQRISEELRTFRKM